MATRKSQSATITLAVEEARKRRHIRRLQLARNKRRREATAAKRAEKEPASVRLADVTRAAAVADGKELRGDVLRRIAGDDEGRGASLKRDIAVRSHDRHITRAGEVRPGLLPSPVADIDRDLDEAIAKAIKSPGLAGEVVQLLNARHLAGEIRIQARREAEREAERSAKRPVVRVEERDEGMASDTPSPRRTGKGEAAGRVMREESGSPDSQLEILHARLSSVHEQAMEIRARAQRAVIRLYGRCEKDEPETSNRAEAAPGDGSLGNLFDILGRLESATAGLSSDLNDLTKGF